MSAGRTLHAGSRPEKDWEEYRAKALAAVGHMQRKLSDATPGSVARRVGLQEYEITPVLRNLRESGLIKVHRIADNAVRQYHVTQEGWDALGQKPPLWVSL